MTVDDELPADRQTLDELIRKAATKLAKTLIWTEVSSQLKQEANNQRGSRQKSASEKKKSGNKVPRDTSKPPPTKQKQKQGAGQQRRSRQRFSQRQRKKAEEPFSYATRQAERQFKQKEESVLRTVDTNIRNAFGFVADLSKSTRQNSSIYLAGMSVWRYLHRPTSQPGISRQ